MSKDLNAVSFSNPRLENLNFETELIRVISEVIDSGTYILGENVSEFEKEFARYIGTDFCLGVNSGTDAIVLGLRSLGIRQGDEIIAPSFTATATVSAIVESGAKPVFVEVDDDSYTLSIQDLIPRITKSTKAIIAVHLYGNPADVLRLREICDDRKLYLVEDVAQACGGSIQGRKLGSIGDIACFSFYPTKNLGAIGDGGAICTNNDKVAESARKLRQYGWNAQKSSILSGRNSRLDEIQAAILRVKLSKLDNLNKHRANLANLYIQNIDETKIHLPRPRKDAFHPYHLFVIRHKKKSANQLQTHLRSNAIEVGRHYAIPVHKMPSFLRYVNRALPTSELLAKQVVSLPMYPFLTEEEVKKVSDCLNDI